MALAEPDSAAREAAPAVSMMERSPQRRRNRACPSADLQQAPVCVVAHHHTAGVARQALRRSRGNARAILEDRGIDVDHHLVALARGAGVDAVVEGRLREQRQRIGLLLDHRRRVALRLLASSLLI
jgi:hypothetical protein